MEFRRKGTKPAERIRDRLSFVVVIHAPQIAPALQQQQIGSASDKTLRARTWSPRILIKPAPSMMRKIIQRSSRIEAYGVGR